MIVKVSSHKRAAVRFLFDNGNEVSVIWGGGTYSDNHDNFGESLPSTVVEEMRSKLSPDSSMLRGYVPDRMPVSSETVEIMVEGNEKFIEWFEKQYKQNPGGYILTNHIPRILNEADKKKYVEEVS